MTDNNLPYVSIVVIGRNEGENLNKTFQSIFELDYPNDKIELIYVDTNSSDNSVGIAKKFTNKVFAVKSIWPTSGLARNKGLIEASHELIHFVDGDIAIDKNYLKKAIHKILMPNIDAVTGYFKEQNPEKFFNWLMDLRRDEIKHFEHFCDSTNGGGTYLKSKLISLNGYDERILKGQESELGIRFREKGYKILFIDDVQGYHNFGINSLFDFLKFKYYYGKSSGHLLKLRCDLSEYILDSKKKAIKTIALFSLVMLLMFSSILTGYYAVIGIYFLFRIMYIYYKTIVVRKLPNNHLLHNIIQYVLNFAFIFGMLKVLFSRKKIPQKKMILK